MGNLLPTPQLCHVDDSVDAAQQTHTESTKNDEGITRKTSQRSPRMTWTSSHRDSEYTVINTDALDKQKTVQELITFEGCGELLRGTRLSMVMRSCGAVFKDAEGSASTYKLSETALKLDSFLSHNWSASRYKKYVALAYHYYFSRGLWASFLAMLCVGALSIFKMVPQVFNKEEETYVGCLGRLVCIPSLCLAVLLWPEVVDRFGNGGPRVFLDKVCIHQTDQNLKLRGIRKLGAFIAKSDTMIVLYGSEYLYKLWTVFELASFLSVHVPEDLHIIPMTVSLVVSVFLGAVWLRGLGLVVAESVVRISNLDVAINLIMCCILYASFLQMYRSQAAARKDFQQFSVAKANCFLETDRFIICKNIAKQMRIVLNLPEAMSQSEVIASFEEFVRMELPMVLDSQIGRYWFPHRRCIVLSFLIHAPEIVDRMPLLMDFGSSMDFWFDISGKASWLAVLTPLAFMLMQLVAEATCHLEGRRAAAGIVAGVSFLALYVGGANLALWATSTAPDGVNVIVLLVLDAVLFLLTAALERSAQVVPPKTRRLPSEALP